MLSHTAEYALRGCLELARRWGHGPVPVEEVAEALQVPRNYLSKILHELGRAGIVTSTRGPGGGFELGREPDRICLAEIVKRFHPEMVSEKGRCILGRQGGCDDDPCAAHAWWKEVSGRIVCFLSETTLADLTRSGEDLGRAGASDDHGGR